jgi:hypothetical protein
MTCLSLSCVSELSCVTVGPPQSKAQQQAPHKRRHDKRGEAFALWCIFAQDMEDQETKVLVPGGHAAGSGLRTEEVSASSV